MTVLIDFWLLLFGVWPLADPGHGLSMLGAVDIVFHLIGLVGIIGWRIRVREARA